MILWVEIWCNLWWVKACITKYSLIYSLTGIDLVGEVDNRCSLHPVTYRLDSIVMLYIYIIEGVSKCIIMVKYIEPCNWRCVQMHYHGRLTYKIQPNNLKFIIETKTTISTAWKLRKDTYLNFKRRSQNSRMNKRNPATFCSATSWGFWNLLLVKGNRSLFVVLGGDIFPERWPPAGLAHKSENA